MLFCVHITHYRLGGLGDIESAHIRIRPRERLIASTPVDTHLGGVDINTFMPSRNKPRAMAEAIQRDHAHQSRTPFHRTRRLNTAQETGSDALNIEDVEEMTDQWRRLSKAHLEVAAQAKCATARRNHGQHAERLTRLADQTQAILDANSYPPRPTVPPKPTGRLRRKTDDAD